MSTIRYKASFSEVMDLPEGGYVVVQLGPGEDDFVEIGVLEAGTLRVRARDGNLSLLPVASNALNIKLEDHRHNGTNTACRTA